MQARREIMAYKIVACDFDDTLFSNKTHSISPEDREAIDRCEAKGVKFIIATGRPLLSIRPYYERLGLKTPLITTGGAEVYDKNFNKIYSSYLQYEDAMELLRRAKSLGVHAHVYSGERFCYEKDSPAVEFYKKHTGLEGIIVPDLLALTKEELNTPKLLMMADTKEIDGLQKAFAAEYPHLNVVKSLNSFVEFYDKRTSKGEALRFLADYLGYSADDIAAVGDTQIDLSMLNAAGLSAAPANAMSDVLSAVDIILNDCEHGCVAQLLNDYIFEK